ncbi:oxidoreductase [Amorphoplanes digitatis]|uniref:2,4-dienoyl-CoA reductase-like NADH-dependent reductase (Old Yellow Enzyme family) n=1 Tax=Actinoplanes digitatis TaxID=1868 RepID=A0A7W7MS65_9ACTN|nr:12-oxophytodienoate reductase [Actinoplanes digitatis]MBB4764330.1 2,4-dienoyl-CoA reductase-like NADH-dependent reductase (Old Yellow Enzyme family) [Actinoplanes digitatis]GID94184.1 oxidoreductase [Actinoplanes digitatis]
MTTTLTTALGSLLTPTNLAGLPLSSRFAMAPMTRFRSPGGVPTPEVAAYYRRRAEHGIGLIISEGVLVGHPSAGHETTVPRMTAGAAEHGWLRVTGEVHAAGGRIAAQLWHLGSAREPVDGIAAWTPSGVPGDSHAMTLADIDTLLAAYADAARVAARAGFDAVEIHAAHGYLLDEFLWSHTNRRTDRFGGSPAARAAFPAEVIRAVRAAVPAEMPIIVRFSQFKERDYAARIAGSPAELAVLLDAFTAAGADVLHASQRDFAAPAFTGSPRNLAGWAKHLTGLPSITVGSIGLTRDFLGSGALRGLIERLDAGEFDLVALGRILLRNPAWVTLAAAGRLDEIHDYRKSDEDTYH